MSKHRAPSRRRPLLIGLSTGLVAACAIAAFGAVSASGTTIPGGDSAAGGVPAADVPGSALSLSTPVDAWASVVERAREAQSTLQASVFSADWWSGLTWLPTTLVTYVTAVVLGLIVLGWWLVRRRPHRTSLFVAGSLGVLVLGGVTVWLLNSQPWAGTSTPSSEAAAAGLVLFAAVVALAVFALGRRRVRSPRAASVDAASGDDGPGAVVDAGVEAEPTDVLDIFATFDAEPDPVPSIFDDVPSAQKKGGGVGRLISATILTVVVVLTMLLAVGYVGAIIVLGTNPPATPIVGHSMNPLLYEGDLVFLKRADPRAIKVGDVIGVRITQADQDHYGLPANIVHRVYEVKESGVGLLFYTKGDNNDQVDPFITLGDNVTGVMVASVPRAGYAFLYVQTPQARIMGGLVIVLTVAYVLIGLVEARSRESRARDELLREMGRDLPLLRARLDELTELLKERDRPYR